MGGQILKFRKHEEKHPSVLCFRVTLLLELLLPILLAKPVLDVLFTIAVCKEMGWKFPKCRQCVWIKSAFYFKAWPWPAVLTGSVKVCLGKLVSAQCFTEWNTLFPHTHLFLVCSKGEGVIKHEGNCQQPLVPLTHSSF